MIVVEELHQATTEAVAAMGRLLPQLSSSADRLDADALNEMVADPGTVVFIARSAGDGLPAEGEIVGTLTLVLFRIPTAVRAWIEDVVVDGSARGRGVGEALTRAALERARAAGARTVDLTSRPSREAANRLYQRLGFALRETNVYRFDLEA